MQKQLSLLALLTVVLVLLASPMKILLNLADNFITYLNILLTYIFAPSSFGNLARNTLALIFTALITTAIPAMIYWSIKRRPLPHIYYVVWAIWLITITKVSFN